MQTALYLRVSTAQQNTDLQADGLREYAARAGLQLVAEYRDHAASGRTAGRPQLQALMRAARQHAFGCVLVWKFDRFARSVAHLLGALAEFQHLGIRFISVQDQVDTESPMGKAMFTIIGAIAELESALISERVKAGMAAARATGQAAWTPCHTSPPGGTDRKISQDHNAEYSTDSRHLGRPGQPLGCRADCEADPRTVQRRGAVTGFYTYPEHTPDSG